MLKCSNQSLILTFVVVQLPYRISFDVEMERIRSFDVATGLALTMLFCYALNIAWGKHCTMVLAAAHK